MDVEVAVEVLVEIVEVVAVVVEVVAVSVEAVEVSEVKEVDLEPHPVVVLCAEDVAELAVV